MHPVSGRDHLLTNLLLFYDERFIFIWIPIKSLDCIASSVSKSPTIL